MTSTHPLDHMYNNNLLPHNTNRTEISPNEDETNTRNLTRDTNVEGQARQRKNTNRRNTSEHTPKKGLRKRANIKITSLNMNGLHSSGDRNGRVEKWAEINATVKTNKIAILALQETHLDEETTQCIQNLFGKRLQIFNSQLERNPIVSRSGIRPQQRPN
jgi:hypothetical protein